MKTLKRGRPSNAADSSLKRPKKAIAKQPPLDVRTDRVDHWPDNLQSKQRCKNFGCKGFTRDQCVKCLVPLCFNGNNNCFYVLSHCQVKFVDEPLFFFSLGEEMF